MKLNLPVLIDTGASPHGCSRANAAKKCPVYYARRYSGQAMHLPTEDEQVPLIARRPPAHYLLRGTLFHAGAAHYYFARKEGAQFKDAVPYALKATSAAAGQLEAQWPSCVTGEKSAPYGAILPRVLLVLRAYFTKYLFEDAFATEVLSVETPFVEEVKCPVTGRLFPFTQKMDLTCRLKSDGLIYYVDHKTTARLSEASARRYTLTLQFLGMQYFGRLRHGDKFGGAWANLAGFDPIRFERHPPDVAPYRLAQWPRDYCYAKRLEEWLKETYGDDAENYPGADDETTCISVYGHCPDTDICQFGPKIIAARESAALPDLELVLDEF